MWAVVNAVMNFRLSLKAANLLTSFQRIVLLYDSVSQPSGRVPVPGPGINYTGPREILLEFVILVF